MGRIFFAFLVGILACSNVFAIKDESNQERWNKPCDSGPDAVVPGFLVNLGPTGARAVLKSQSFVVRYIFKSSPAAGVLKLGDEIIAANGKTFNSHNFGGRAQDHGIDGPIFDFGMAIEDSEGKDGVLRLKIKRNGMKRDVAIQLEKLGRFAKTFPLNCKKTEILKARAYKYMMDNPGGLASQGRCVAILSMLSSNDPKVFAEGKRLALAWNNTPSKGTWSWNLAFQAITLAEYYLITRDNSVMGTLKDLIDLLRYNQFKKEQMPGLYKDWVSEKANRTTLDKHLRLYDGGYGHEPFPEVVSRGGGGYGPMQRPTYLAAIAYQLGRQCGIKLKHDGLESAFGFIDRGTNEAGCTGYGGEFTLNNGPINSVQWKARTNHGNSHRSAMVYMLYKLSPERKESKEKMKLHLANVDVAYKDMAHGHACSMLGLVWGWIGVFASDDDALKKKIFDYYKAYLNMSRCHGSKSYIVLPGRDYADYSYYRGNSRAHTTACAAILYSFSTPKLQVQGVRLAIPGVDPLTLTGKAASAYKLIVQKKYGQAARSLKTLLDGKSKSDAVKMLNFVDNRSQSVLVDLKQMKDQGQWYSLQSEMGKLRNLYAGVPIVDKNFTEWTKLLTSKPGKVLVNAERDASKDLIGKACASIDRMLKAKIPPEYAAPAKASKERLDEQINEFCYALKKRYSAGEWYTLKKTLEKNKTRYAGIERFDTIAQKLYVRLNSDEGKILIKTHSLARSGALGQASIGIKKLAAMGLEVGPKFAMGQLSETISLGVEEYVQNCQQMLNQGQWLDLREDLTKNRTKMKGAPLFDRNYKKWRDMLQSRYGRAIISINSNMASGKIGSAGGAVAKLKADQEAPDKVKEIATLLEIQIERVSQEYLTRFQGLEEGKDWYKLSRELSDAKYKLKGIPSFDKADAAWQEKLRKKSTKRAVEAGRKYYRLEKDWTNSQSSRLRKKIESFRDDYGDTVYAQKANALLGGR